MAQITRMRGENFKIKRSSILVEPTNHLPPVTEGNHLYLAHKLKNVAAEGEPVQMAVVDPWGDETTDFLQVPGYLAPVKQNSTIPTMGGQEVLFYTLPSSGRIVMRQYVAWPTKKWTFSAVYTVNGIAGGSGNRCLFSLLDKAYTKYLCIYATTTSEGPAKIITGTGNISPLGVNTAASVSNTIPFTLAANTKEIFSYVYDGTAFGGRFYVYRNGALIVTLDNIGVYTLEGEAYLGTDVRSGTASSDFKGEIGDAHLTEYALSPEEVTALHTQLNKAFL